MNKTCFKCKIAQPVEDFYVNRKNKDGRHSYCKGCQNALVAVYLKTPKGQAAYRRTRLACTKRSAKRRGLEWALARAEFHALMALPCFYCDDKIGKTTGLDRTDNAKGYIIDNVVPCCQWCNIVKGDRLTKDEMLAVARLVLGYAKTTALPYGISRYLTKAAEGCTGWRGRKYYGRPVWMLWMQRALWEVEYGALGRGERVTRRAVLQGA